MNEIQMLLLDAIKKIMSDFCAKEKIDNTEPEEWFYDIWKTLEDSGMTTVGIPEGKGGSGGTMSDALYMLRAVGEFAAPIPLAETLLANWYLEKAGLPISTRPLTIALIDENDKIEFTKNLNQWTVSGEINNVPWARIAEKIVIISNYKNKNIITTIKTGYCNIEKHENIAGEPRDMVYFKKENKIPVNSIATLKTKKEDINIVGSLIRSSMMAGALQQLLNLSVEYAKERKQFGRSISKFQAIQQYLAILAGEVTASQNITNVAIEKFDFNEPNDISAISSKIRINEAVYKACPIAHQIFGAIGFTQEHSLNQYTRRLWSWREEYGTESFWSEILGSKILAKQSISYWESMTL